MYENHAFLTNKCLDHAYVQLHHVGLSGIRLETSASPVSGARHNAVTKTILLAPVAQTRYPYPSEQVKDNRAGGT